MRVNGEDQIVPAKAQRVQSHACWSLLRHAPEAARLQVTVIPIARHAGGGASALTRKPDGAWKIGWEEGSEWTYRKHA